MINARVIAMINNQYIIRLYDLGDFEKNPTLIFQSYDSIIARIDEEKDLTIYSDYNFSKTTSKYLKEFLKNNYWTNRKTYISLLKEGYSSTNAIDKMIKDGQIIYDNK